MSTPQSDILSKDRSVTVTTTNKIPTETEAQLHGLKIRRPFGVIGAREKPRVLLALPHETSAKGIFDSKAIDSLASYADLDFLHAYLVNAPADYFNRIYVWPRYVSCERAWLALYQLHLLPFTCAYYPERLGDQNLWQGFRPYVRWVLPFFDNAAGRAALVPLLRAYLSRTNPLLSLLDARYDAIACVTGLKDPMYEDVVRFGRARKIPVFAVTQNWDNLNYKPIVERPDYLRLHRNFSVEDFARVMNATGCVVGNTSASLREGAFLGVPAVNIGNRQQGRERAGNVIDVPHDSDSIERAIRFQLSNGRYPRSTLYGDGKAACRIAEHLATLSLKPIQKTLVLRIPCYFCCEPGGSAGQRDPVWTVPMSQAVL